MNDKKTCLWAQDQCSKILSHKHKDLRLNLQNAHMYWICNLCISNPTTPVGGWEAETRKFSEAHRPVSMAYVEKIKRPYPKQDERWRPTPKVIFWPPWHWLCHTHANQASKCGGTQTYTQTHTYVHTHMRAHMQKWKDIYKLPSSWNVTVFSIIMQR